MKFSGLEFPYIKGLIVFQSSFAIGMAPAWNLCFFCYSVKYRNHVVFAYVMS